ncbi:gamma-glutamyl-gamma-aminobutyrate hydrolase family protein [Arthrobacter sp. CG_A4]|uniref:gamma-glutamyl-gamma-aminobutyrate hydrolase family protein n=1 Tax=Arthrobacter sp. CG_A4 TaxID=3071706 RepID=UPI002E029AAD|nr:gamma-glutamyl-gamma-aminobutyrate hydrolase family protein [Arthrobacter sp. CG_A4]MEC5179111.1 putative glutamine amidotransferase [Arthrobacter sp. CG_A4]
MALNASERYRPRIALTSYYQDAVWGVWNAPAAILPGTYVEAVVAAGGTPILLPPLGTDETVLDIMDGLIVVGGPDVDPTRYGAAAHPRTVPQPLRDEHDTILTRAAIERGLPLFAICRGAQILNVALNGSLNQHIPDINPAANYQPAPGVFGEAAFTTAPGSLIQSLLGDAAVAPCYHHQGMDTVPPALRVTASSADGTVQALEAAGGSGWVLGVQFHPEQNPADLRLFRGFVEAAGSYRANRKEMSTT